MNRIRVMVVDDSVVVRKLITDVLSQDPGIEVVGTAANGKLALGKLEALRPEILTMDIEMPEMDGIETVKAVRKTHPRLPIIMFSTLTERGAQSTLDALSAGANDYVTKPANVGSVSASMESVREQLVPKLRALTGRPAVAAAPAPAAGPTGAPAARQASSTPTAHSAPPVARTPVKAPAVLVIGSSTGGPEALAQVVPRLPATFPLPVLIVQHMPPVFTRQFAGRLDRLSALTVVEATAGVPLAPGTVHLAPGDFHLTITNRGGLRTTALSQGVPENFCRPAVDVLFRSAVAAYDGAVLSVVLTGMGHDGRDGTGGIRGAGGWVIAQDQATSVVWGMPGAVTGAGYADEVLPLAAIADAVSRRAGTGRPAPGAQRAARPPVLPTARTVAAPAGTAASSALRMTSARPTTPPGRPAAPPRTTTSTSARGGAR